MDRYDIYCCYHGETFTRFASTLERSVHENCPDANLMLEEQSPPPKISNLPSNGVNNLAKVLKWQRFANSARRPFILMDADMFVNRDIAPVWTEDFDVAYCLRPHRCPIIGGFIPCRPTASMREFMRRWVCHVSALAINPTEAKREMSKYGGLLQCGLNYLRDDNQDGIKTVELSADTWNCCDQVWHTFDEDTRVVHMKGRLRQAAMKARVPQETDSNVDLAPIIQRWLQYHMGNI